MTRSATSSPAPAAPKEKPGAPPAPLLRSVLSYGVLLIVVALLGVAFVQALPDAVERLRQGRLNRVHALCGEALRGNPESPVLGQTAPDFTLADWRGNQVQLSSLRGRVVLLNFWFTQCPPCIAEVPSLEKLARTQNSSDFSLLTVSVDPDWPTVRKFFAKGTQLTVLLDAEKEVPPRYGTEKFPESFLIDRDGRVLLHVVSDRDWSTPAVRTCIEAAMD